MVRSLGTRVALPFLAAIALAGCADGPATPDTHLFDTGNARCEHVTQTNVGYPVERTAFRCDQWLSVDTGARVRRVTGPTVYR